MDYTGAAHGKPGKGDQKQRSGRRKRAWTKEQRKGYETLPPYCERCGHRLPNRVQPSNLGHKKHRGMGGSWDPEQNKLSATRTVCQSCHDIEPGWDGVAVKPLICNDPESYT